MLLRVLSIDTDYIPTRWRQFAGVRFLQQALGASRYFLRMVISFSFASHRIIVL